MCSHLCPKIGKEKRNYNQEQGVFFFFFFSQGRVKFHVVSPSLHGEFTTAAWPSGCLPETKHCAVSPNLPTQYATVNLPKSLDDGKEN